jgi:arsenate reductase
MSEHYANERTLREREQMRRVSGVTITMYGIKNCDTIKKARAWLDTRGIAYEFHDYKTAGLDRKQLEDWTREVGWEPLVNRAGTTFRKLADAEKTNLDEKKALALMLANPSLVKRPVLAIGSGAKARRLLVGFSPDVYAEALGSR